METRTDKGSTNYFHNHVSSTQIQVDTKWDNKIILTVTHVTGEDRECLIGHSPATVYKLMLVFDTLIASYQNQKHEWY